MSFLGQLNFGYPVTSHNIITDIPDNAVLPLSIGSSLQGNILGVTFGDLKSQVTPPGPVFTNDNTPYGINALAITQQYYNVAIGAYSMDQSVSAGNNTAVGAFTLRQSSAGANTAVGFYALNANTSGDVNTAIGQESMSSNSSGRENTALGYQSLYNNNTGEGNTAIGYRSLIANKTSYNTAVGRVSAYLTTTGYNNVALGDSSLFNNTTGICNTAIGRESLSYQTTAQGNTAVGYATNSNNFSNSIILGREAAATASNQFVIGSGTYNAGTIATETITPNRTWTVRINGANYKIPLLAI